MHRDYWAYILVKILTSGCFFFAWVIVFLSLYSVFIEVQLPAYRYNVLFFIDTGDVWMWGSNDYGQLAKSDIVDMTTPFPVPATCWLVSFLLLNC